MNYKQYGKIIGMEEAKVFCDGNQGLFKVLLFCVENKIATYSCCSGHFFDSYEEYYTHCLNNNSVTYSFDEFKVKFPEIKRYNPYVAFCVEGNSENFLKHLLNQTSANKFLQVRINCVKSDNIHNIMFGCKIPKNVDKLQFIELQNEFFEDILKVLESYNSNEQYSSLSYELMQLFSELANRYEITYKNSILKETWSITDKDLMIPKFEFEKRGPFSVNKNVNSVPEKDVAKFLKTETMLKNI